MKIQKVVFVLATILASAWSLWLVDDGLSSGWPTNVLRNWLQFGLLPLHGSLVQNPGGFEIATHPDIYYGMSPLYLYPVFFCTKAFEWTGWGFMPFHILLAVLVFWGIWSLLGKNTQAMFAAALVVVSPGYCCYQKGVDPNSISVLVGFPYAALVVQMLKNAKPGFREWTFLILLTAVFVPLNWTTAWFLAPFGIYLLLNREVHRRPVIIYLALTALGSIAFVGYSMAAKHGASAGAASLPIATSTSQGGFLSGYTWGTNGYYEGLSTVKFFTRLAVISLVGSAPLILWWVWQTLRCLRVAPRQGWLSILPLLMALAQLAAMRNYFCHHPWMGSPVLIAGIILSLALQAGREDESEKSAGLKWVSTGAAGAVLYSVIVLAVKQANSHNSIALDQLVRENIARTESVVILKAADPATAALAKNLDEQFDRHVLVVESLDDTPHDMPFAILSSCPITNLHLAGESPPNSAANFATKAANWFNQHVGHRKANDRLEFATHYYIYRPGS